MPKLTVFNQVTLDGYFTGENGDLSWAHNRNAEDPEWRSFIEENAKGGGVLVFGRVTYDLMASYWPTPEATKNDPVVAKQMNALPKLVFSRTLEKAEWTNTKLIKGDPATELRKLKHAPGQDMVIFGSGSIVAQLAQAGLIDEYQLVLIPVVLGKGKTLFEGVGRRLTLQPIRSRSFRNGNILLCYEPEAEDGAGSEVERGARARAAPRTVGSGA
ncbi:MAG TPA: dihydrofolate reductase family protein [Gemmatimonadales bacterium]|nr:dihydrofolate reductase family protein [Gemmatimonadales bacterium]